VPLPAKLVAELDELAAHLKLQPLSARAS
jgi:hypothetical protein